MLRTGTSCFGLLRNRTNRGFAKSFDVELGRGGRYRACDRYGLTLLCNELDLHVFFPCERGGQMFIDVQLFLACYNAQGNYLWHRTDTFTDVGFLTIYNLQFDSANNIYIGGRMFGLGFGSFLGFTISEALIPHYILKTNPDASQLLWSSYSNGDSEIYGGIVLHGSELGLTSYCGNNNFTWGNQTMNVNNLGQGQEVLLARFNKDSGACIGLSFIPGNNGFNDVGTAITADVSGDYILGGAIGGTLTFNNNMQITNSGSQSDFFVAKYATQACSPLAINENETGSIKLYPNPSKDLVYLTLEEPFEYVVYNMLGLRVLEGQKANGSLGIGINCLIEIPHKCIDSLS